MMRVLGICSYPIESAATRFRLAQFVEPLRESGIELDVSPFLNSDEFQSFNNRTEPGLNAVLSLIGPLAKRISEITSVRNYDVLFVQREAMFFGPAFFEKLYRLVGGIPMVLDLDDATYVRYVSPRYGRLASNFKFFGKTDNLIRAASTVVCGNRFISEYVNSLGASSAVIPTVVDTDKFRPVEKDNKPPVIGWIGTHSTFPFLRSLFPVLTKLAREHAFVLKIVGSGRADTVIDGVQVIESRWQLDDEVSNFQNLDIGLYPITLSDSANHDWLLGKSGFKAIQYFAVGVPFVMTPIGVTAELGEPGVTHFNATNERDWYTHLDTLLSDRNLRLTMGEAGRGHSLANFTVKRQAERLVQVFREACGLSSDE